MMARLLKVTLALLLVTMVAALSPLPAFAQGGATSTLQGIVKDSSGGVVPGADVVAFAAGASGPRSTGRSCVDRGPRCGLLRPYGSPSGPRPWREQGTPPPHRRSVGPPVASGTTFGS